MTEWNGYGRMYLYILLRCPGDYSGSVISGDIMPYIEINDLNEPRLSVYTAINEAQLLHYYEPNEGLFIAETRKVVRRALEAGFQPESLLVNRSFADQKEPLLDMAGDVPVYLCNSSEMRKITGYNLNEGFLCAMHRKKLLSAADICRNARRIAVLESVVNPTNIGAVFRSAAAMGIEAVLLTPGCCDPLYRRAIRVSMGNVFLVPWTYIADCEQDWREHGVELLHGLGFKAAAMALRENTLDIRDPLLRIEERLAILLGTEGEGLCDQTIENSDYTVKIPMTGGVDSLNVAAASAVAFWELAMR
ncbi:MAG: TrmH family RNA methyltransferase [Oscillospiraceae bacterium]